MATEQPTAGTKPFKDLPGLSEQTLLVLNSLGYATATPVQEACIPLFTGNKDVAVDACTGSGKTLAFVVPIIEKLRKLDSQLRKNEVGAIIVSPTRELARQIYDVAQPFFATIPWLKSLLLVGGTDPLADVAIFESEGGNVIVSTPGRLADVMKRSQLLELRRLEVLVLDEADRLLDMGFRAQLDYIMGRLPKQRRTGLFSATQTEAIGELARAGLRNPVRVKVAVKAAGQTSGGGASQRTPLGLSISYQMCESTMKLAHLLRFLQEHKDKKVIVYALTCACVNLMSTLLKQLPEAKGLNIRSLHGRMKQSQRQATLAAFIGQEAGSLLCTDVAARGLDIPDVNWIVQLDPPQDPDAFVHRVGRTARMGRTGNALIFLLPHEATYVDFLRLRKVPLEQRLSEGDLPDMMPGLRHLAESDRDVLEKGIKAFVSYVRGYKEHQCKYIFRIADLDLGQLAAACALLQLPRMPEIRKLGGRIEGFTPSAVNPNEVKFKDKARQKLRTAMLEERKKHRECQSKEGMRSAKPGKVQQDQPEKRLPAAKRRLLEQRQDETDFAEEYTLLKKLKRGKLTEHEFDLATGLLEEDEPSEEAKDPLPRKAKASKQAMGGSMKAQQSRQLTASSRGALASRKSKQKNKRRKGSTF